MVVGDEPVDSQEMTQEDVLGRFAPTTPPLPQELTSDASPVNEHTADASPADWQSDGDWTSEPTRQFRKRLSIGVAATAAVLVTVILAAWSLTGSAGTEPLVLAQPSVDPGATNGNRDDVSPGPNPAEPEPTEPEPAERDLTQPERIDPQPDTGDSGNQSVPTKPLAQTPLAPQSIPSDLMPANVLADAGSIIPATGNEEGIADPLMDLPPELAAFIDLIDLPGNAPDAPPATQSNDAAGEELLLDQAAGAGLDPMLLATPPPEVNLDNALKIRAAIQTKGYPLAGFVLLCSEVTQVPIQIDWVTLDLAGISLSQKIRDAQPGWKPIGDLINGIADQAGLVFEREETRLFLTLAEADFRQQLDDVLRLDDFAAEKESTQDWVTRFAESTQWNERDRLGLRAMVTDSLRTARSLPPKLSESARSHWIVLAECLSPDPEETKPGEDFPDRWPLLQGGESGVQLDTSITLAGLLRRTSRFNDATCVVNWDDARQRRLSPGQLVLPFAGKPAGEMLTQTLTPMGLEIRRASSSHWWVGTAATYDRMPLLVVGDELGPRRDEILARIRDAGERAGTLVLLQHDVVSDRYLSLMPRFLYRQLPTILKQFLPE